MTPAGFAWVIAGALVAFGALVPRPVAACPFCSAPAQPLVEQIAAADVALLVRWTSGAPAKLSDAGHTEFEVVEVVRQPADGIFKKGPGFTLRRAQAGKAGDLFLLLGTVAIDDIEWGTPIATTRDGFDYIRNAPRLDLPAPTRLAYYLKFLEHPDVTIADDAFAEFANASYEDVATQTSALPRDSLRIWLTSRMVPQTRIGLYGMMLGLCGTQEDAKLLQRKILEVKDEFRLGIDGVMGGYLLLTGEQGLKFLEDRLLRDETTAVNDLNAFLQAVRFIQQYGAERIRPARLLDSMHLLLDRPDLADMVITDLARLKDWSIQDRLMQLYGAEGYGSAAIRRAIVRYTLAAIRDTKVKPGEPDGEPAHVAKAKRCLEELEKRDPKRVHEARRFLIR